MDNFNRFASRAAAKSPIGRTASNIKSGIIISLYIIAAILILSGSLVIRNGKTPQGSTVLITGISTFIIVSMYLYYTGWGVEKDLEGMSNTFGFGRAAKILSSR